MQGEITTILQEGKAALEEKNKKAHQWNFEEERFTICIREKGINEMKRTHELEYHFKRNSML